MRSTMSISDYAYKFKIVIIGNPGVGKTSLLLQYTEGLDPGSHTANIGIDFKIKRIELDNIRYALHIWDTCGQERYLHLIGPFYRGANGIMVVYDVTSRKSFENVQRFFEQVEQYADSASRLLIANKCDLHTQRQVEFCEGQSLAERLGVPYFETSAIDSTSVEMAFTKMAADIKNDYTPEAHAHQICIQLGRTKPMYNNPVFSGLSCCL